MNQWKEGTLAITGYVWIHLLADYEINVNPSHAFIYGEKNQLK